MISFMEVMEFATENDGSYVVHRDRFGHVEVRVEPPPARFGGEWDWFFCDEWENFDMDKYGIEP